MVFELPEIELNIETTEIVAKEPLLHFHIEVSGYMYGVPVEWTCIVDTDHLSVHNIDPNERLF